MIVEPNSHIHKLLDRSLSGRFTFVIRTALPPSWFRSDTTPLRYWFRTPSALFLTFASGCPTQTRPEDLLVGLGYLRKRPKAAFGSSQRCSLPRYCGIVRERISPSACRPPRETHSKRRLSMAAAIAAGNSDSSLTLFRPRRLEFMPSTE